VTWWCPPPSAELPVAGLGSSTPRRRTSPRKAPTPLPAATLQLPTASTQAATLRPPLQSSSLAVDWRVGAGGVDQHQSLFPDAFNSMFSFSTSSGSIKDAKSCEAFGFLTFSLVNFSCTVRVWDLLRKRLFPKKDFFQMNSNLRNTTLPSWTWLRMFWTVTWSPWLMRTP